MYHIPVWASYMVVFDMILGAFSIILELIIYKDKITEFFKNLFAKN